MSGSAALYPRSEPFKAVGPDDHNRADAGEANEHETPRSRPPDYDYAQSEARPRLSWRLGHRRHHSRADAEGGELPRRAIRTAKGRKPGAHSAERSGHALSL